MGPNAMIREAAKPIRVLIADDDDSVRTVVAEVLASVDGIALVSAVRDAGSAIEEARVWHPDVALLDVCMPGGGGLRATAGIRDASPATRSLAYSASGDRESVDAMLEAGACGYLVKGAKSGALIGAIRAAAAGHSVLSQDVTTQVVEELARRLSQEGEVRRSEIEREAALRQAIDGDVMTMVFQPVARLDTRRVVGYEALARFAAAQPRSPDLWFADAAAAGCLLELELKAVGDALRATAELRGIHIAVNLSPATLLAPGLLDELARRRLHEVVVEITEHAPVDDYARIRRVLGRLRESGVRLAVDDVGSGYASLRHIVELQPDILKVDISLVRGVESAPLQRGVIKTLVTFAHELGAELVAEGIETRSELEVLTALGVTLGQGYYLGRPSPLDGVLAGATAAVRGG